MIYLLLSALLYSLNNLLWKKVLQQDNSWLIMTLRALLTSIIGIVVVLRYYPNLLNQISKDSFCRVTIASMLGAFGLIFMISALKKGTLRLLGIFNLLTIAFTVTYLLLFEKFNILNYLSGTSLIILGFSIYIFQIKKTPTEEFTGKVVIYYTLMSLFFASSGMVHWYNFKQSISPLFSVVNQEIIVFLLGVTGLWLQPKSLKTQWLQTIEKSSYLLIGMAVLIFAAVWTGFLGLKSTNPLLSSLLSLSIPILTIFFGALFFKEKLNKSIFLSLLIITIGAFILHFKLNQF